MVYFSIQDTPAPAPKKTSRPKKAKNAAAKKETGFIGDEEGNEKHLGQAEAELEDERKMAKKRPAAALEKAKPKEKKAAAKAKSKCKAKANPKPKAKSEAQKLKKMWYKANNNYGIVVNGKQVFTVQASSF